MLIERIESRRKYVVDVWDEPTSDWEFKEPFGEELYTEINSWCYNTFKYRARTAYNRFEFKREEHLTAFILRWS